MNTPSLQPSGFELLAQAVHKWEAAKAKLAEAKKGVESAKAEVARTEAAMASLVASGRCDAAVCQTVHGSDGGPDLHDESVRITWRIAFQLLRDPVLHYRELAETVYGPDIDRMTAKNRINSHMTILRKEGIAKSLGHAHYEIDAAKLAERSGIPVPARMQKLRPSLEREPQPSHRTRGRKPDPGSSAGPSTPPMKRGQHDRASISTAFKQTERGASKRCSQRSLGRLQ